MILARFCVHDFGALFMLSLLARFSRSPHFWRAFHALTFGALFTLSLLARFCVHDFGALFMLSSLLVHFSAHDFGALLCP
jgi:hypothetical protein